MVLEDYVVDQAMQMFLQQGIKSVRMDDIASQCGISKRTLYEMVVSREALVEKCLGKYVGYLKEELTSVGSRGGNVIESFWLVFERCSEFHDTNKRVVSELQRVYPKLLQKIMIDEREESAQRTLVMLESGVEQGYIMNFGDLRFLADIMSGYFYGLSTIGIKEQRVNYDIAKSDTFILAIMIFFRGITTEKGRQYIDERLMKLSK